MQLHHSSRAFTAASRPPPAKRGVAVLARAGRTTEVPVSQRVAPALLAALVSVSGMGGLDAVLPLPAHADEEETMSPYQKRQAELEKRRELLREAREKAAARAAGGAVAPAPAAAPEAPAAPALNADRLKKDGLKSYEAAAKNRPAVPVTPTEPAETPALKPFGGFSFSKPAEAPAPAEPAKPAPPSSSSSFSTPPDPWNTPIAPKSPFKAPAPVTPAPTPAPAPAPKPVAPVPVPVPVPVPAARAPAPAKPAAAPAKPAAAPAKPGKRRGPLPLWFAELLVLGAYVGGFLAATKYSDESGKVLRAVWEKILAAYGSVEKLVKQA